jgi:hypothetical protein
MTGQASNFIINSCFQALSSLVTRVILEASLMPNTVLPGRRARAAWTAEEAVHASLFIVEAGI